MRCLSFQKMRVLAVLFLLLFFVYSPAFGADKVTVADLELRVKPHSTEVLYYGFAEGDELLFSIKEETHKELKEVEVLEYPATSRYQEANTHKIKNQSIKVGRKAVYSFRLYNAEATERICHTSIYRIPASERTQNFNTAVIWKNGYDTTYETIHEPFISRRDTSISTLMDQVARVHSRTTLDFSPNRSVVDFSLPAGTVVWSYWLGVGDEGKKVYKEALQKFIHSAAGAASRIPDYGPMIALALEGLNYFTLSSSGDNVQYALMNDEKEANNFRENKKYIYLRNGNIVTDFARMYNPLKGKVYLGLLNDNIHDAIDVNIKVVAVVVKETVSIKEYRKPHISPKNTPVVSE